MAAKKRSAKKAVRKPKPVPRIPEAPKTDAAPVSSTPAPAPPVDAIDKPGLRPA